MINAEREVFSDLTALHEEMHRVWSFFSFSPVIPDSDGVQAWGQPSTWSTNKVIAAKAISSGLTAAEVDTLNFGDEDDVVATLGYHGKWTHAKVGWTVMSRRRDSRP